MNRRRRACAAGADRLASELDGRRWWVAAENDTPTSIAEAASAALGRPWPAPRYNHGFGVNAPARDLGVNAPARTAGVIGPRELVAANPWHLWSARNGGVRDRLRRHTPVCVDPAGTGAASSLVPDSESTESEAEPDGDSRDVDRHSSSGGGGGGGGDGASQRRDGRPQATCVAELQRPVFGPPPPPAAAQHPLGSAASGAGVGGRSQRRELPANVVAVLKVRACPDALYQ